MAEIACATWNIHGGVGRDGRVSLERIAAVLREIDADVCALQEVDARGRDGSARDALSRLADALGMTAVAGPARHQQGGFFGNALLSRFPVVAVEHIDISVPGREPRAVLDAVLDVEGAELQALVTHFGLRRRERVRQADALLELVRRRPHVPALVAGDFNEWVPRSTTIARLDHELGQTPAPRTFPARLPLLRLDRIWVRPRGALSSLRRHETPLARSASDHLPVVATVALRGPC